MNLIRKLLLLAIKVSFASNIIISQNISFTDKELHLTKKCLIKKSKPKLITEINPIDELT
jgi:hypothetical protein